METPESPRSFFSPVVSTEDSLSDKLAREGDMLLRGSVGGIGKGIHDAIENPLNTAAKAGVAGVIGAGLASLQVSKAGFRPGVWILSGALAYGLIKDVAGRLDICADAVADTWKSKDNLDRNTKVIADTVGPFVVDSAIAGFGGSIGGKITNNYLLGPQGKYTRIPTLREGQTASALDQTLYQRKDPLVQLYDANKESVVKISRFQDNGTTKELSQNFGTGFFISKDGKIATNAHVVDQHTDFVITTHSGEKYWAKVLGLDHKTDVAVLGLARETPGITFRPLKMSTEPLTAADPVVALGYPQNHKLHRMFMSPGKFEGEAARANLVRVPQDLTLPNELNVIIPKHFVGHEVGPVGQRHMPILDGEGNILSLTGTPKTSAGLFEVMNLPERAFSIHVLPGNSGSPILNMRGEVVAITTKGAPTTRGMGAHADYVTEMLAKYGKLGDNKLPSLGYPGST